MILFLCLFLATTTLVYSAPTPRARHPKSLSYYDYIPEYTNEYDFIVDENDYIEENDLSRAIPGRKRRPFNSPIYYIRLPPQPYMFVPGLGYISQPPPPPAAVSDFVNLPVSFLSNGKPSTVYQWAGGLGQFPTAPPPTTTVKPPPVKDSNIHRLTGQFSFNGKPEDIFVLRDSYNSLYGDALQNFYP